MDDKMVALIEKLAAKLGTTSEYLWAVLTKQALISGITDIAQYIALAVVVCLVVRYREKLNEFGSDNEFIFVMMCAGGIVLAIVCVVAFFCIGNTVSALFNPEYWALKQVLSVVK